MRAQPPRIREVRKEDEEINSKDLTKKGVYLYIFGKFIEYSYVVLCAFFDLLVLPSLAYYILSGRVPYVMVFTILLTLALEVVSIYIEIKIYLKLKTRLDYRQHMKKPEEKVVD